MICPNRDFSAAQLGPSSRSLKNTLIIPPERLSEEDRVLRKFAEGQGQSAGEFFTPTAVGFLMAEILRPAPQTLLGLGMMSRQATR